MFVQGGTLRPVSCSSLVASDWSSMADGAVGPAKVGSYQRPSGSGAGKVSLGVDAWRPGTAACCTYRKFVLAEFASGCNECAKKRVEARTA